MFAAALKESEALDKAKREKERERQEAEAARKAEARAQADALATARRDLERAIQAVRDAKRNGRSTVEADAAWKAAKARVIELETGTAPTWAPPAPVKEADDGGADGADGEDSPGDDASGDDAPSNDAPSNDAPSNDTPSNDTVVIDEQA
jgi:hypothetical protein